MEERPVRRLRKYLDMSQSQFAAVLDSTQATVAGFETKAPPGRRLGFAIWDQWRNELHELRITLDDLFRPFPVEEQDETDDTRPAA
jgi:transcriptional regulator with XRE-family HTH domain